MNLDNALQLAVQTITGAEGFAANPYWDVNGYAIGYGNHYWENGQDVQATDGPIDQDRALALVTYFANENLQAIASQLQVDLNDNQLAALTSLRYNCGTITTTLLNLINSGADPDQVAAAIQTTCTTVKGVQNAALAARRVIEANLYSSPAMGIGIAVIAILGVWWLLAKK